MDKKKHIFLASPHMSEAGYEQAFIKQAFDTNWIAPLGENVDGFEKEIVEKTGAKRAAALNSGTAAIQLALKLAGVKTGDLVFCQSLTFSATANPILYENAIPVFIDSDYETWNMSPKALKAAFEKYENLGKRPKAVIVVHLYGMAADVEPILRLCREYNVVLIEDAAESLGSLYKGKYTGSIGDYGIFSFNGNKIITSSGGGMLLCNSDDADIQAQKARFWATQSREPVRHYQHEEVGYNYRMSNIVAGIGRGQLKVLDQRVSQKRFIYSYYKKVLGRLEGISFMPMLDDTICNCWLTAAVLEKDCNVKPLDIMVALEENDVESRPIWKPMHMQPLFKEYDYIDNGGVAKELFLHGVCLPSDTKMSSEDLNRVCRVIQKLWE